MIRRLLCVTLMLAMLMTGAALADQDAASVLDIACEPTDIIQMPDGSFLVTDAYYKVVLLVKDGVTSLYAGTPTRAGLYGEPVGGYRDSQSDHSTFRKPWAITTFAEGYAVTDTNNHCVRYVSDTRTATISGNMTGGLEETLQGVTWANPTGLTTDEQGDLYVADTGNGQICRINHSNGKTQVVCSGLEEPTGLAWHEGCLYIAQTGHNRVLKWDRDTDTLTVIAGNGEADYLDGTASDAAFAWPLGVEVGEDGTVYVADSGNCAIRMLKDGVVSTLMMADMEALDQYPSHPQGMLCVGDTLYVCDPYANKVYTVKVGQ